MRKAATIIAAVAILANLIAFSIANAADQVLTAKADTVTEATAKTGSKYVRVMISEEKEVNGVKYNAPTAVMFFGDLASQAKAIKPGSILKVVVTEREWQGRKSYTAVAFPKSQ